jgi:oligopeptide transport system permease protein
VSAAGVEFGAGAFEPVVAAAARQQISRPSLSYWQDAWRRLKRNPRALTSLGIVAALLAFTVAGPWVWRIDPASQDVTQISQSPGLPATMTVVAPYVSWEGVTVADDAARMDIAAADLRLAAPATTQAVQLVWNPVAGATGYRVYRNVFDPSPDRALGLPLVEIDDPNRVSVEDRFDLRATRYWYSLAAIDAQGTELDEYAVLVVDVAGVTSAADAAYAGWIADPAAVEIGDEIALPYHPLGTDYLGRDMLARLMHGARVSLFIGIVAPLLFVLTGILYGSAAGFAGGRIDQFLMRFADFVVALPFLIFMIIFRIAFGIGPGESGVVPMLIALVVLMWPATARLVRGQVLQIRQEGYVAAAQLLGAGAPYLVFRHMIPNTMGVILVTLTFEIPKVIFIEAFLSFIGMGVAPPTPSWGSMANEGIKTMLVHPHELLFPAILISLTVLAFNLLGDGLRDALDVRLRGSE